MNQNNCILISRLWIWIVVLVLVGVFFRFYNIGKKVYWHDEVGTSLVLSGHTVTELIEEVFDGHELSGREFQRYQRINFDRSWISTITSLATDNPQHPPLYYALVRFWAELFDDPIHATRSLAALISLLVFPGIYWLCRELFDVSRTAWMAVALVAVSPFHVLYAQEARQYSLWTATMLLSSAALLCALRQETWRSWGLYAATVALGFYSHTLFGLLVITHAVYVAGISLGVTDLKVGMSNKALVSYFFATLVGLVAFAPWAWIVAGRIQQVMNATAWVAEKGGAFQFFARSAVGFSAIFLDVSYDFSDPLKHVLRVPVVILALYSVYFLYCRTSKRVWLFVLMLIGTPTLALMLPDVVLGGRSISQPRFLIPCYLGFQLGVAHLLATQIVSARSIERKAWQTVSAVLILSGIVSCAISSQADAWWNKSFISMYHPQTARIINKAPRPLLISDSSGSNPGNVISLSYLLHPKVRLRLVVDENDIQVPDNFSDVFLFRPSAAMRRKLENGYRIEFR